MCGRRQEDVRFAAVVATPRTGSTLLCEALAQHPAVLGFGEIFLHEEEERRAYHEAGCGDAEYYNGGAPGEYLARLAAVARALAGEQSGLWHARAAEVRVALSRAQLAEWRGVLGKGALFCSPGNHSQARSEPLRMSIPA